MYRKTNQQTSKSQTIATITARAGVSISTVSRVLHHRPDVAPKTRERVEQIIRESGFMQNRALNLVRKGGSGIIDVLLSGLLRWGVSRRPCCCARLRKSLWTILALSWQPTWSSVNHEPLCTELPTGERQKEPICPFQ